MSSPRSVLTGLLALLWCSQLHTAQSTIYTLEGDFAGDRFGLSVGAAGDVDGDGYPDVLVGSPSEDNHGSDTGAARIFSGRNGAKLHLFDGDVAGDVFGAAVGGGGDLDLDGVPDVLVGARGYEGRGYVRAFSGASAEARPALPSSAA